MLFNFYLPGTGASYFSVAPVLEQQEASGSGSGSKGPKTCGSGFPVLLPRLSRILLRLSLYIVTGRRLVEDCQCWALYLQPHVSSPIYIPRTSTIYVLWRPNGYLPLFQTDVSLQDDHKHVRPRISKAIFSAFYILGAFNFLKQPLKYVDLRQTRVHGGR